jgi:hypothetical protein
VAPNATSRSASCRAVFTFVQSPLSVRQAYALSCYISGRGGSGSKAGLVDSLEHRFASLEKQDEIEKVLSDLKNRR